MAKDPYKNSPYDASGMPLGATYVDYDDKGDVAQASVKDKPVTDYSLSLAEATAEYEEPKIKRTEPNPADFNSAIEVKGHKHPTREDHIGIGIPEIKDMPKQVDIEDPFNAREAIVEDSIAKGFKDVPKLPDVAKQEDVDNVLKGESNTANVSDDKKDAIKEEVKVNPDTPKKDDTDDDDFQKALKNV